MEKNKDKKKTGLAAASITLGIISIILSGFWYIVLPAGILALIFGAKTAKRYGSKLGKAGIVTSIIGLSLFLLYYGAAILIILNY